MWRNREATPIFNTFCEGKPGQRSIAASGAFYSGHSRILTGCARASFFTRISTGRSLHRCRFWLSASDALTSSLIAVREHKAGEPVGYVELG